MMDIKEIMSIIPHRYPFLLIDKVIEMEEGKSCTAIKNVTMNEPFFQGHFPGEQTGAVAMLSREEFKGKIAFFGGIDKAKFRGKVTPGDTLRLEVEMIKIKRNAGIGKGIAYVDGKKVAEGELTFMIG